MEIKEYLDRKIEKKLCPNCGLNQCHSLRWCHNDGGEFQEISCGTIRWQILTNIKSPNKDMRYSWDYWYAIHKNTMKSLDCVVTLTKFIKEVKGE